ncbi:hypothetical protein HDU93_003506 [Gonapodya sp. JEL0774]|nr:hypothetical protein HDU93_003506 [Gonapodya sp. JEL0774]
MSSDVNARLIESVEEGNLAAVLDALNRGASTSSKKRVTLKVRVRGSRGSAFGLANIAQLGFLAEKSDTQLAEPVICLAMRSGWNDVLRALLENDGRSSTTPPQGTGSTDLTTKLAVAYRAAEYLTRALAEREARLAFLESRLRAHGHVQSEGAGEEQLVAGGSVVDVRGAKAFANSTSRSSSPSVGHSRTEKPPTLKRGTPLAISNTNGSGSSGGGANFPGTSLTPSQGSPPVAINRLLYASAPFVPQSLDEVGLAVGDPVYAEWAWEDGWGKGLHTGTSRTGFFPLACVASMAPSLSQSSEIHGASFPFGFGIPISSKTTGETREAPVSNQTGIGISDGGRVIAQVPSKPRSSSREDSAKDLVAPNADTLLDWAVPVKSGGNFTQNGNAQDAAGTLSGIPVFSPPPRRSSSTENLARPTFGASPFTTPTSSNSEIELNRAVSPPTSTPSWFSHPPPSFSESRQVGTDKWSAGKIREDKSWGGILDAPVALHKKYSEERDKRLRSDGNDQWLEITPDGPFGHFLPDPYVEPLVRESLDLALDVLILGGGFAGLIAGAKLTDAAIRNFRIIGAMCDTESYVYLPLLEETGYVPVAKYTKAPEILAHCDRIAGKWKLHEKALFQTETRSLTWDERTSRWNVTTNRGDTIRAKFILQSTGGLEKPKLPGAPGIEKFKGHTFYTGGDSSGGLVGLQDKIVGIIGTGATAVQINQQFAYFASKRTPSSIDVRGNRPTDPDWAKSLRPGWQRERMYNFTATVSGVPVEENLVDDGWTVAFGLMRSMTAENRRRGSPMKASEILQLADFINMERIRKRVNEVVKDKETAEALKPWYNQFCKRPCFHDEYLETYNRPNVKLVDSKGKGIERVTENGVIVQGQEYKVDCLIFATGFFTTLTDAAKMTVNANCPVIGRGGRSLEEKWATDGFSSIYGFHTRGFPNYFYVQYTSQAAQFVNAPNAIHLQIDTIVPIIVHSLRNGIKIAEVSAKAEQDWVAECESLAALRISFYNDCTPGYYNSEGRTDLRQRRNVPYGAGAIPYTDRLTKWIADGGFVGFEFDGMPAATKGIGSSKASL